MARWAPFLGLAAVLTVGVLLLARRSAVLLREPPPVLGEPTADQPTVGVSPTEHPRAREFTTRALLANVLATQGILAVIVLVAIVFFDIPQAAVGLGDGPWVWGLDAAAVGLGLGVALWLGSEAAGRLADAAGLAYDEGLRELLAPETPAGWVVLFVLALPVIASAEELLFRAALIGVPAAALNLSPWLFVGVSAGAFALGHGAQGRVGIVATGLLGLLLGAAFVLTESLLVVVLAHYVVNALEFGVHELAGID